MAVFNTLSTLIHVEKFAARNEGISKQQVDYVLFVVCFSTEPNGPYRDNHASDP